MASDRVILAAFIAVATTVAILLGQATLYQILDLVLAGVDLRLLLEVQK